MTQAQTLARSLNAIARTAQFSNTKARAAARTDGNVDWPKTKARNDGFNPDVDGCEAFVMTDGSVCAWHSARASYAAEPG
ncbi:MAG: hypothetical protein NVS2B3_02690 [Vulcanimicrobiaceae bacterium]